MERIFSHIYENKLWGNNNHNEYKGSSGDGSGVDYNKKDYIPFLKNFIKTKNVKTVVDLGCGDFRCGELIYGDLDVKYTGYDAYKKVVECGEKSFSNEKYTFRHLDFCNKKEEIVGGDLCILKDVIQHWSLRDIYSFLDYIVSSKKFKYILICNCCNQTQDNTEIQTGDWRELSCDKFPLKRYCPKKLMRYQTKEVCVIEC
jgi:hypothetical protein